MSRHNQSTQVPQIRRHRVDRVNTKTISSDITRPSVNLALCLMSSYFTILNLLFFQTHLLNDVTNFLNSLINRIY